MKKTMAFVLSALAALPVMAGDEGFYAGLSLGYANVDAPSVFGSVDDDSTIVAGAIAGYQFNPTWGVEAEFTGAGKFKTATAKGKADVLRLSAIAMLPLTDTFNLYGRLGVAEAFGTGKGTADDKDRSAATFGVGLQYDLQSNIALRAGWDRYKAAISTLSGSDHNYDSDVINLAVTYKF